MRALRWPAGDPVVDFAAEELGGYLERLLGARFSLRPGDGPEGHWIRFGRKPTIPEVALPADTEAVVQPDADGVTLAARSPRALLTAAYALLETLGCSWSPHGPADERVLRLPEGRPLPRIVLRPAFARRAYAADIATWHYTIPERLAARLPGDLAFVDWVAKTGGTGVFFIRHANDTRWTIPELVPALRRRGLAVEIGGHALVELLPRGTFAAHPEYFPLTATGERSDLGNCCPSSPGALALVRERVALALDGLRADDEFHLWGLDLLGGGWCRCPACAGLAPSDQALTVCNHVVDALPGRLFHLAYHDTIAPPDGVRPDPRVWAEFAPRERCYGHALDDPACATNGVYRNALLRHLERFDGRVHAFEYYADAILFGGCAVPLTAIIEADLAFYRRAGVRGVSCLTFGQYSLWAYGWNLAAFAQAACDPSATQRATARHCERVHGARSDAARQYLAGLERLFAGVATYGDVLLPPRRTTEASRVYAALDAALVDAADLRRLLAHAGGTPADVRLLDYTLGALQAVRTYLSDHLAGRARPAAAERAGAALREALAHVRAVDPAVTGTWGAYDLEIVHHLYTTAWRD